MLKKLKYACESNRLKDGVWENVSRITTNKTKTKYRKKENFLINLLSLQLFLKIYLRILFLFLLLNLKRDHRFRLGLTKKHLLFLK